MRKRLRRKQQKKLKRPRNGRKSGQKRKKKAEEKAAKKEAKDKHISSKIVQEVAGLLDEEEDEDDCGIRMPFDLNGKVYGVNNESTLYEKNGKQPKITLGFRYMGRRKQSSNLQWINIERRGGWGRIYIETTADHG